MYKSLVAGPRGPATRFYDLAGRHPGCGRAAIK